MIKHKRPNKLSEQCLFYIARAIEEKQKKNEDLIRRGILRQTLCMNH